MISRHARIWTLTEISSAPNKLTRGEKTARLRALRLARDAASQGALPAEQKGAAQPARQRAAKKWRQRPIDSNQSAATLCDLQWHHGVDTNMHCATI